MLIILFLFSDDARIFFTKIISHPKKLNIRYILLRTIDTLQNFIYEIITINNNPLNESVPYALWVGFNSIVKLANKLNNSNYAINQSKNIYIYYNSINSLHQLKKARLKQIYPLSFCQLINQNILIYLPSNQFLC